MVSYVRPKFTKPDKGFMVITSDDGRIEDYTHWLPVISKAIYDNNQFKAKKPALFCPATNTGYIEKGKNRPGYITMASWEQIAEMHEKGVEFTSHGKYHVYLYWTYPTKPATAGSTRIYYTEAWYRLMEGYKFFIQEGDLQEEFTITKITPSSVDMYTGEHYFDIASPLKNNYTTKAKIHISYDSAKDLFSGVIQDFANHGITIKQHINTWYRHTDLSKEWLKEFFESICVWDTGGNIPVEKVDLYFLSRTNDISSLSESQIDTYLQQTIDNDTLLVVQGHGGITPKTLSNLEYIIRNAIQRGIKIGTMSDGVEYLKKRKQGLI